MTKIRLKSASALDRFLKMAYYNNIDFKVCIEDNRNKINYIVELGCDQDRFASLANNLHYSNYEYL